MPAVLGGLGRVLLQQAADHPRHIPGGAEEWVQERGMPNCSEGNIKTGENVTLRNN